MRTQEVQRWLQLTLSYRIGPGPLKQLREAARNLDALQGLSALQCADLGLTPQAIQFFLEWQRGHVEHSVAVQVDAALQWLALPGNHLVLPGDADYPPLLATCADAPPHLFVRGELTLLSQPQFALVGTRRPSADGKRIARRFAAELVQGGYQITSGLALGIDTESHLGALNANGKTIAVLGSGLGNIYPKSNKALAETIVQHGALVSEYAPFANADNWHFPARNRIISGLSHGVLVVEAAEQSGSLITARLAAEQGREVFAIPGSINNPMAQGCHRLIRQGVKLVEKAADIFEEIPALVAWERKQEMLASHSQTRLPNLTKPAKELLSIFGFDPLTLDTLLVQSQKAPEELLPMLTQLELQGQIELQPEGYVRVRG